MEAVLGLMALLPSHEGSFHQVALPLGWDVPSASAAPSPAFLPTTSFLGTPPS